MRVVGPLAVARFRLEATSWRSALMLQRVEPVDELTQAPEEPDDRSDDDDDRQQLASAPPGGDGILYEAVRMDQEPEPEAQHHDH